MIPISLGQLAAAVGGRLDGGDPAAMVTGPVVVDSRQALPGSLFGALAGAHTDGHRYARVAVASGAVAVLAARPVDVPAVLVPDVVAALGRLARWEVDRLPGTAVVGITGSSGKTGTKDLLAGLLARLGPTVAPQGSWNNEIGHPLTVLRAGPDTRFLVLECSARGVGHIAELCRIAPPRVGAVLNVGTAHVGVFGSRSAIARAKAELVEALPPGGCAVLNADDPLVAAMAGRTRADVLRFGLSAQAEVRATGVTLDERGRPQFRLSTPAGSAPVRLGLYGEHQVGNALAAAAVAGLLGLPLAEIAAGLAAARPVSRWRMEVTDRADGVTVVNDAYNANPESTSAALRALVAIGRGRRTWAVLGEMAELGPEGPVAHQAAGELARECGVDRVLGVGPLARELVAAAGERAQWLPDAEQARRVLERGLAPGDVVLVKASRAAGLERVAEALLRGAP